MTSLCGGEATPCLKIQMVPVLGVIVTLAAGGLLAIFTKKSGTGM